MYSKYILTNTLKGFSKWIFFFVVYPYMVMSLVYSGGVSFTGLLFSYISIVPTLLAVKAIRSLKRRSVGVNEFLCDITKQKFDYNNHAKAVIVLKSLRIIALVGISLLFAKWLFGIFSLATVVSSSLTSFLIALLQIYYMAIIIIRIKYER